MISNQFRGQRARILDEPAIEGTIREFGMSRGAQDFRFLIQDDDGFLHSASHYSVQILRDRVDCGEDVVDPVWSALLGDAFAVVNQFDAGQSVRKVIPRLRGRCQQAAQRIREMRK